MRTDTFGQLIDRIVVARLKQFHHADAGHRDDADHCGQEADRLTLAMDELVAAIAFGDPNVPPPRHHARFHDHAEIEGRRDPLPETLGGCIEDLVGCHATYWHRQTHINWEKGELIRAEQGGEVMMDRANEIRKLIVDDQRELDLLNQRRNELVQKMDELLLARMEQR